MSVWFLWHGPAAVGDEVTANPTTGERALITFGTKHGSANTGPSGSKTPSANVVSGRLPRTAP
jgi:hypothetical protein